MKQFFFASLLTLSVCSSFAQGRSEYSDFGIPTKDGAAFYEVVDSSSAKDKNKDQIYQAVKKAISDLFGNAKAVIEIDDKDAGQVIGKGQAEFTHKIQLGMTDKAVIKFTVNIQCKNGKYRIQLYDFQRRSEREISFDNLDRVLTLAKGWRTKFLPAFHERVQELLQQLTMAIAKNLKGNDDF